VRPDSSAHKNISRSDLKILLECGCRINSRVCPMPRARLSCTSGLQHGYRLTWVEYKVPSGAVIFNNRNKK